jgi:hypothetical protein
VVFTHREAAVRVRVLAAARDARLIARRHPNDIRRSREQARAFFPRKFNTFGKLNLPVGSLSEFPSSLRAQNISLLQK